MSTDEQAALVTPELLEWARGRARHVAPIVVEQGFLLAQEWTRGIMERSEDVHT